MLDDFSSESIIKQMEEKKEALKAVQDTAEQINTAKNELEKAEDELSAIDRGEKMALIDLGNVGPIRKFFSTFFKRGKYYEYQEKVKELSTKRQTAKTNINEAKRKLRDAEKEHDSAIRTNDNTKDASKVYEKTDKGLTITDISQGINDTVYVEELPSSQKVFVHCTDRFPASGEILGNFDGGKVLDYEMGYHGITKTVSSISNRHEVHLTQNNRVESTGDGRGNWDSVKFIVIDSYEGIEDDIESDSPSDSWTKGKSIKLSPKAVILVREDALDEISPEDRKNLNIVVYRGDPTKCLRNFLRENGYSIAKTDPNYSGHARSLRFLQERSEDLRNYAIHYVTNDPVLTQERPVIDESQIGAVADVYMWNNPDKIFFSDVPTTAGLIDLYMEKCGLNPEDREALVDVLNFVVLTGLKKTDDGKSYTFKSSEEILDEIKYYSGKISEMSSPQLSLASPELVLEVFRQRQKAQMEYSQSKAPSIESVQEMSTIELFDFKNQKAAEVVSNHCKEINDGIGIIFAPETIGICTSVGECSDLSLKYQYKMEKEGISKPEYTFYRCIGRDSTLLKRYPATLVKKLKDLIGELRKDAAEIDSIELPENSSETRIEDETMENPE